MMGLMMGLMMASSLNLLAKTVVKNLTPAEGMQAIRLASHYEIPTQTDGTCSKIEFEIVNYTRGFNPSEWSVEFEGQKLQLNQDEISAMIQLHNRIEAPSKQLDPITDEGRLLISAQSCGGSPGPYDWFVQFDDLK